jgi:hypothetical protein
VSLPAFPLLVALATAGLVWRAQRRGWREAWSAEGAVAAGLTLLSIGFFWQFWLLPGVSMPRGGGDLVSFLYPTYRFAADALQRGELPFWDPHLFAGAPFAADLQSGLYYPPNLIAFLVARPFEYEALETLAALHYPLAGLAAYVLGRELGLGRPAAFAVGVGFAFSGFAVAHLGHYNMLAAASLTPLALALGHRAFRLGDPRWAALTGGAVALVLLAGHTQIGLYCALALGVVWLLRLRLDGARPRRLLALPLALAAGVAGAAVLLLPAFERIRLSIRSDITYAQASEFAASPLGLITFVVPRFFGDNAADYWGLRWSLHESYGYVGLSGLLLAALGVLLARRRDRPPAIALLGVLALLFALGETTPLQGWLYRLVPGFDKVRAPGRFLLFVDLALALLIGFGVQRLGRAPGWRDRPRLGRFLFGLSLVAAAGALVVAPLFYYAVLTSQDRDPTVLRRTLGASESVDVALLVLVATLLLLWRWRRRAASWLPAAAVALLWLDLAVASAGFNPTAEDLLRGYRHEGVVRYLQERAGEGRIDTRTGVADVLQPDLARLYGLEDVAGLFDPLTLRAFDRYWEGLGSRGAPGYDLLSVRYLVARRDAPLDPKFRRVHEGDAGLAVFENAKALPRAFVAARAEALPEAEITARLRDPGFDPRAVVLVDPGAPLATGQGVVERVERLGPNALEARLSGVRGGYLVLTNVLYPGWRARVDGREVAIQRAYGLFQAVLLPEGASAVRFDFKPRFWEVGLAATLIAWLLIGLAGVALLRARAAAASPGGGTNGRVARLPTTAGEVAWR